MPNNLELSLPIIIERDIDYSDVSQIIERCISDFESEFIPVIAPICIQYDPRADFCEGSLNVESVSFDNLETDDEDLLILDGCITGSVDVTFDWYAHYGCKDMHAEDQVDDSWAFRIENDELKFSLVIPEERYDEF
ncbi:hypothetical protein LZS85_18905 [Aliivibrio fischeri]|uniref:Uncharacterized protein n=1 Tax=Aliivibrio fischeri (strain MJ11) TaxID=388396 RepID=B5EU77_ALIFM|nr:hypothetical protein [Aliivibrio fischeri]ACH63811.1 hypothetical protein VFMJ11_A0696 [Aliivibrio fischeri MJ11]MCE7568201.1 hypothetical protein [Aliivibrio fischeri]MUJ20627.1 hypothetical protein [Aliivibrio fischeri]